MQPTTHAHPKKERTLVLIKPDGVQRSLMGEIISRFERVGVKLVAMKFINVTEEQCWAHYKKDDAWFLKKGTGIYENRKTLNLPLDKEPIEYGRDIIRAIVKYMTSGPVVAMIWEGAHVVQVVKKLTGATDPVNSDVGTIRGDYTFDSYFLCDVEESRAMRNLLHCTDGDQVEAQREIDIWFKPEEIINYRLVQEEILYDVNLDGALE
ncbi:MAG: putative Nucleoside diphosphate kinase [Candidatus Nomurabacteria bacterium]|nr:putative Nucleoside diphosphate kinase [Candidatus Nomurabacteria bacterium]